MLSLCSKEEFDYLQRGLMVRFGHCARVALNLNVLMEHFCLLVPGVGIVYGCLCTRDKSDTVYTKRVMKKTLTEFCSFDTYQANQVNSNVN